MKLKINQRFLESSKATKRCIVYNYSGVQFRTSTAFEDVSLHVFIYGSVLE